MQGFFREAPRFHNQTPSEDKSTEIPTWLNDIIVRFRQSHVSLTIDNACQLNLPKSITDFIIEIIRLADKDKYQSPGPQFLQEIKELGIKEIENICSVVDIILRSQDQKEPIQFIQQLIQITFPLPAVTDPKKTFNKTFELPDELTYFTGREEKLDYLVSNLSPPQMHRQSKIVICGSPGIGKTQLAVSAAHRLLTRFEKTKGTAGCQSVIRFIAGTDEGVDNQALMSDQFYDLGVRLNIDPTGFKFHVLIEEIYKGLSAEYGPFLVIFDNALDLRSIQPYLPPPSVKIIITTRNSNHRDWGYSFTPLSLGTFSEKEAHDYIQKYLSHDNGHLYDEKEALTLAKTLGLFPLALTQALAHITTEKMSVMDYVNEFEQQKDLYLQRPVSHEDPYQEDKNPIKGQYPARPKEIYDPQKATIWTVIQLSLKKIKQINAIRILNACAYLAPESPIDVRLLACWVTTPAECREMLGILRNFSLLENAEPTDRVRIHQLVQEILLTNITKNLYVMEWGNIIMKYTDSLRDFFSDMSERRYFELLPHTETLLNHLIKLPNTTNVIEIRAYVLFLIGSAHYYSGNDQDAISCYESALVYLRTRADKKRDFLEWLCLRYLACAKQSYGESSAALIICKDAFSIANELKDPNYIIGISMSDLGWISFYCDIDTRKGALDQLEKALKIYEANLSSDHPLIVKSLWRIGVVINEIGDSNIAVQHFERSLVILEKTVGKSHYSVGGCLLNLATAIWGCGELKKARGRFYEAKEILKNSNYKKSAELGVCLMNLGALEIEMQYPIDAKACLEEAIPILKATMSTDHAYHGICLMCLGMATFYCGDVDTGLKQVREAHAYFKRITNKEPSNLSASLKNLGIIHIQMGEVEKAVKYLLKALKILRDSYDENYELVGECYLYLGAALIKRGRDYYDEAKMNLVSAVKVLKAQSGKNLILLGRCLNVLGEFYTGKEDYSEAVDHFRAALIILKKHLDDNHTEVKKCELLRDQATLEINMQSQSGPP